MWTFLGVHHRVTYSKNILWDATQDISGWTGILEARSHPQSLSTVFTLTEGAGLTLNADGTIDIDMTDILTTTFSVGDMAFEIFLTDPGGPTKHRAAWGTITVNPTITS